jgi:hypothetical protein
MSFRFAHAAHRAGLVLACLAAMTAGAGAQNAASAPPPPLPCSDAAHRQFDFWIGTWDVFTPDGKPAGENRIEPIAGGCALLENWSGRGGFSGKSLNFFDSDDRRWHQTWVDSTGGTLVLAGGLVERRMVLGAAATPGVPGSAQQRIAWTPADDGSVRQLWESSTDGGATWKVLFDGKYVRRK